MTTLSVQRTAAGVLESADSATVAITDSTGAVTLAATAVTATSEGVYSYDAGYLTPGNYTATWVFSVTGQADDTLNRVFTVDGPVQVSRGVTLAEIERRFARMAGPFRQYHAYTGGSTSALIIRAIQSSLSLGDFEDMFILRRGVMQDGTLIDNFPSDDRQRLVATYDSSTGTLTPDRAWSLAPTENEAIELHYLDPDQEIRPVVLDGLRRCYFWDEVQITTTSALREINLTESALWLTDHTAIKNIEQGSPAGSSLVPTSRMLWYRPFVRSGNAYIQTKWIGAGYLYIMALRSHFTYVNGETTISGPDDDFDVFSALSSADYPAMAALCEAWVQLTDRLTPVAAQGLRITSTMAASRFTEMSRQIVNQQPEFPMIKWESDAAELNQVGNA